tara:strand:+ start:206 stop:790 length:585 start_codon:yes stop_codon:yes gene_type:complete
MSWAVAIPAIASIASGLLASKSNKKATQRANTETRASNAKQMAFQERMSNTAYQRGMQDMQKSGLNPILAGKMGGATSPAGASYQAQKANPVESASAGASAYMQNRQMAQNLSINKHAESFANFTGIPIEQANSFMKQAYSAKYMYGTKIAPKINKVKITKSDKLDSKGPSKTLRDRTLNRIDDFDKRVKRGRK